VVANLEMKFDTNEARIVLATEVASCQAMKSGGDIFNMTKNENDLAVFKGFML
jgi:uncharacterized membrane protein YvbJ